MNYQKLKKIKKIYFGYEEIARALGISAPSARVSAVRFIKYGFLVRIKRNVYVLKERWNAMDREAKFSLANVIQVPSYISLMTALSYYQLTTLVQRDFFESNCIKRSQAKEIEGTIFNYTKINKSLYFGFIKSKDFFMATPEKAFLDAVYLSSLKRYRFDRTSIDIDKLDMAQVRRMAKYFPKKTQKLLEEYGEFKKTRSI